jgi:hypothetical protein
LREKYNHENILIEGKIVVAFIRLGGGNSLQMCGEVYPIAKSMASIIMKEFCVEIKKHFK